MINKYLKSIEFVSGIFAEFGVHRGNTFKMLLPIAKSQNKYIYGIDSFKGMDESTEDDAGYYPKGSLSVGGVKYVEKLINDITITGYDYEEDYQFVAGFIPDILDKLSGVRLFSFCYVDLDQYEPTKKVIEFIWDKVSRHGLVLFDDYIESYDILASKAIKEFLNSHTDYKIEEKGIQLIKGGCKSQLLIRKT